MKKHDSDYNNYNVTKKAFKDAIREHYQREFLAKIIVGIGSLLIISIFTSYHTQFKPWLEKQKKSQISETLAARIKHSKQCVQQPFATEKPCDKMWLGTK